MSTFDTFDDIACCGLCLLYLSDVNDVYFCVSDPQVGASLGRKPEREFQAKKIFHLWLALPNEKPRGVHMCGEIGQSPKQESGFMLVPPMISCVEVAHLIYIIHTFPTAKVEP